MSTKKLNSMRLLEQSTIPYEVIHYPDDQRDAEVIAEIIGAPPHIVYKTLVVQPISGGKPFLILIASDRRLDMKRAAVVAGEKKVQMATHKDAESLTGLQVGGISPLALTHKNWKVYLDQPATKLEHLIVSGGQRGTQLRVPTLPFMQLTKAIVAELSET